MSHSSPPKWMSQLSIFSSLTTLHVQASSDLPSDDHPGGMINDRLAHFAAPAGLTSLNLSGSRCLSDVGIANLKTATGLTCLDLSGCCPPPDAYNTMPHTYKPVTLSTLGTLI
eukprot:scaffold641087_cov33-Prasinocladus_malaysianus.AAC.1